MTKTSKLDYERTETDLFLKLDGLVIAKRGRPNSEYAGRWIALEPGYEVLDSSDGTSLLIHRNGVRVN
jgi:hypothetical protein